MTARERADAIELPAELDQVSTARRWPAERLGRDHPVTSDAVLGLSEMVTNAFVHGCSADARDRVRVSFELDDHLLRVEVVDPGRGGEPHVVEDRLSESHRGLLIVRHIVKDWGFERIKDGRLKVWYEIAF